MDLLLWNVFISVWRGESPGSFIGHPQSIPVIHIHMLAGAADVVQRYRHVHAITIQYLDDGLDRGRSVIELDAPEFG
jgi:hypothetical protein